MLHHLKAGLTKTELYPVMPNLLHHCCIRLDLVGPDYLIAVRGTPLFYSTLLNKQDMLSRHGRK